MGGNKGNPQDLPSPQPVPDPVIVLCQFANKTQLLVMQMDLDLRETRLHSEELVKENKQMSLTIQQMSLTIQSLNETIAARDAAIEELKARIES